VLTAVTAQYLKLRRVQDRASPGVSLLGSYSDAPGRGPRRRSTSVSAPGVVCALAHRGPVVSCLGAKRIDDPSTARNCIWMAAFAQLVTYDS
jgi:hypothetical protein